MTPPKVDVVSYSLIRTLEHLSKEAVFKSNVTPDIMHDPSCVFSSEKGDQQGLHTKTRTRERYIKRKIHKEEDTEKKARSKNEEIVRQEIENFFSFSAQLLNMTAASCS